MECLLQLDAQCFTWGYSSNPISTQDLRVGITTYKEALAKHGAPAISRIIFPQRASLSYFYKTPEAKIDKGLIMRGSYKERCQGCARLTLAFEGDRGGIDGLVLAGYSVESPALEGIYSNALAFIEKGEYLSARTLMEQAANEHYSEAEFVLGLMYIKGDGGVNDYKKAHYWLQRAAATGYVRAQYDLGAMYRNGEGVQVDHKRAKALYSLSAQGGYPIAAHELARIFQEEGDQKSAEKWFVAAKNAGYVPEMRR